MDQVRGGGMYLWKRGKQAAGLIKVQEEAGFLGGSSMIHYRLVTESWNGTGASYPILA